MQKAAVEKKTARACGGGYVLVVGGSPEAPSVELVRGLAFGSSGVVACDRGVDACRAAGVVPLVLVGDYDSADPAAVEWARREGARVVSYPAEKDDTDLALAIGCARELLCGQKAVAGGAAGTAGEGGGKAPCDLAPDEGALAPGGSSIDARVPDASDAAPAFAAPARDPSTRLVLTGVSGGRLDHALGVLGTAVRAADLAPRVEEDTFAAVVLSPRGRRVWEAGADDVGRTLSVLALQEGTCVSEAGMHWNLDRRRLRMLDDLAVSNVVERAGASVELHGGAALVIVQRENPGGPQRG